jgi:hypothetical protein
MTSRTWIASAAPLVLSVGFFLAHCSGSASTGIDGGSMPQGTGTGAGTGTGEATGTGSGHGTSTGVGTGTGTGIATGTGTGVATGTGTGGGGCGVGPANGTPCDPGSVACPTAPCAVPANECCVTGTTASSSECVATSAPCSGSKVECDEAADCSGGKVCCLNVTSIISETFDITCQAAPCPSGIANGQICKTNAECSTGSCSVYMCVGQTLEACASPNASCKKM